MPKANESPTKSLPLRIQHFAQIRDVDLQFGDLTVLVGPQGSGKSLSLQWLKLALDGRHVTEALKTAGEGPETPDELLDLVFGAGMAKAWRDQSSVTFRGDSVRLDTLSRRGKETEALFYVPAHRSLLLGSGWPLPFQKQPTSMPVVARLFSQTLYDQFNKRDNEPLFPLDRVLRQEYRDLLNQSIFHQGTVDLERVAYARRLKLSYGDVRLDYMAWTAGQREFAPLLMGLYRLLPARKETKIPGLDWVVIEEPEMGLHPQAITAFIALALELLWRGYRLVLSTHSPDLLTAVWMLKRLQQHNGSWKLLTQALGLPANPSMQKVASAALSKSYRAYALAFDADGTVMSHDITGLDPDADNSHEADWGGLTGFSSRFGDAVRAAVNGVKP